jgi:signal transduction histidine kinase
MERLISLVVFNAAISHEISQPLNFIKMAASSLIYWQKYEINKSCQETIGYVQGIYRQAVRIEEIINHFRHIADQPNKQNSIERCHLPSIIIDCRKLVEKKFSSSKVQIKLNIAEQIPLVKGTPMGLQQIIANLLSNAIEATKNTGQGIVDLSLFTQSGSIVIEIKDNGTGFLLDNHAQVFNPFFSTKKHGNNMGLGLALVQYFIQLYDGKIILLNNYPPPGAICRVEFPIPE